MTMEDMILFRRVTGRSTLTPFIAGFIRNVSKNGIRFTTDELLAEGDIIDLFFKEHHDEIDTQMRSEIIRSREIGVGYEIDVKFLTQ